MFLNNLQERERFGVLERILENKEQKKKIDEKSC